ncbi:MAG: DUF4892 domain-containing protein, partial [Gammaproteobacteria bacterium]|nr:DUF4892 domain-containing protein [Gammaproteobacteria bacterium]
MKVQTNPRSRRHLFILCCCALIEIFASRLIYAQQEDDISGASDHAAFGRFPDSKIILYEETKDENYQLVLGNFRRVAGRVVPESVKQLRGDVTRITYEVSNSYTSSAVFAYFVEQAQKLGYTQLFRCSGRECGNSNYWANTAFNNRILYGPERNQFFMALELSGTTQTKNYLSVYVITRANKRLYAYLEIVDMKSGSPSEGADSLLQKLRNTGSIRIRGLEFDEQDRLQVGEGFDDVVSLLEENLSLQIYLVAHLSGAGDIASLKARSLDRA